MSDGVAVGLITAVSTLLAVCLTGTVSVWISRGQLRQQQGLARMRAYEDRASRKRDVQRDAYLRFLGAVDDAYRQLDRRWNEAVPDEPEPERADEAYDALRGLDEAHSVVLLEGSDGVIDEAKHLVDSVNAEYHHQRRVRSAHVGSKLSVSKLEPHEHRNAINAREERRAAFTAVARNSIDEAADVLEE